MEKRILKGLGVESSRLGMGLMRLPEKNGKIDYETAEKMIDRLMESGVTYYDTAWFYHDHTSEAFAGRALISRYPRNSFTIATKMPVGDVNAPEDADRIFDIQRSNLGVETIDFYLLHGLNWSGWEKCANFGLHDKLRKWKKEGKLRFFGFSFHGDPEDLGRILDAYNPDFVQIQLNYYDWFVGDSKALYHAANSRGVNLIVMGPVRGGALVNLNEKIARVFDLAEPGRSAASYALRWCASLSGVDIILSGMTTPEQVEDNIKTFQGNTRLSDSEREVIDRAMNEYKKLPIIPCTQCKYCKNCHKGIEIYSLFAGYNEKVALGGSWLLENYLKLVPEGKRVTDCEECGKCEKACPQNIEIVKEMKRIYEACIRQCMHESK
ncbi:MAG: aldo/keto reductase [Oscillospiraceae bacterium]|nr:aldo/keto reductase [Oscillospiraceae bacterium]